MFLLMTLFDVLYSVGSGMFLSYYQSGMQQMLKWLNCELHLGLDSNFEQHVSVVQGLIGQCVCVCVGGQFKDWNQTFSSGVGVELDGVCVGVRGVRGIKDLNWTVGGKDPPAPFKVAGGNLTPCSYHPVIRTILFGHTSNGLTNRFDLLIQQSVKQENSLTLLLCTYILLAETQVFTLA